MDDNGEIPKDKQDTL